MAKRNTKKMVEQVINSLDGFTFISIEKDGHGWVANYEALGMKWAYNFDATPTADYTEAKTAKGIKHSMLCRSANRGFTNEQIYGAFK
jgi:hypothetical protein